MTDDKSKLPPVVWTKRGETYSEEEAEAKTRFRQQRDYDGR